MPSRAGQPNVLARRQQRRFTASQIECCCGRDGREFTVGHEKDAAGGSCGTATGPPSGSMRQSANSGAGVG